MSSSTVSKEERLLLHLTPTSTFGGWLHSLGINHPAFSLSALQKILQREEESTCNTLTLRHAPNQTWNALAGIIHTTAWAENSRNTARRSGSPGDVPALCGPGSSTGSSSGLHGTAGSSWDHSFPLPPGVYILISDAEALSSRVQMDVYLESRPEQDFIVISAECDSENITLGFHSARKLLLVSVNREITPRK